MPRRKNTKHYNDKELAEGVKYFAGNVKALLEEKDMSQSELSRRSKVALSTINEILNYEATDLRFSTAVMIGRALKVSWHQLVLPPEIAKLLKSDDIKSLVEAHKLITKVLHKLAAK